MIEVRDAVAILTAATPSGWNSSSGRLPSPSVRALAALAVFAGWRWDQARLACESDVPARHGYPLDTILAACRDATRRRHGAPSSRSSLAVPTSDGRPLARFPSADWTRITDRAGCFGVTMDDLAAASPRLLIEWPTADEASDTSSSIHLLDACDVREIVATICRHE